jgi:hypothetical protein
VAFRRLACALMAEPETLKISLKDISYSPE